MNSSSDAARRAIFWTFSAVLLAFAIADNDGRYSVAAMVWLSLAIASAVLGAVSPDFAPDSRRALNFSLGLGSWLLGAVSLQNLVSDANFLVCAAISGAIALVLLGLSRFGNFGRLLFPAFLLVQLILGLFTIGGAHQFEKSSSKFRFGVRHDVQWFNQEAARLLLAGQNPYATRMQNVMGQDMPFYPPGATGKDGKLPFGYVYMPLGLFFILPAYLLGDFRFAHVLALVGTAYFLAYARPSSSSKLAATLFLLFPLTPFVLILSWTEPVALFFLAATLFCAFRVPKWLFLALGCLLCAKQYTVFLLPLLPILVPEREKRWPLVRKSVAVALILTLPMALWNLDGFFRSAVQMQFKQPFRLDSLSYLVTVLKMGGPQLSPALGFGALLLGLMWGVKKMPRAASSFAGAGALAFLGFFALNKQAFANYYFWVFGLLVAAVAIALPPDKLHEENC